MENVREILKDDLRKKGRSQEVIDVLDTVPVPTHNQKNRAFIEVGWDRDLDMEINASPVLVGRRVYLTGIDGVTIIIEVDRKYKEIARPELGEKVYATPAFMDGRIYMRSEKNLFCISDSKQ